MQDFFYKYVEETDSFCAQKYTGDDCEVTIPSMHWGKPVTMLYDDLFKGHAEIESIHIPDTVREIGGFVFDGCTALRHITLPQSLENMWQYAFVRSSIEEIVLPKSVRYIVPFTFKDCKDLRRVVGNKGLLKVWMSAFEGCTKLTDLQLPETTETVF